LTLHLYLRRLARTGARARSSLAIASLVALLAFPPAAHAYSSDPVLTTSPADTQPVGYQVTVEWNFGECGPPDGVPDVPSWDDWRNSEVRFVVVGANPGTATAYIRPHTTYDGVARWSYVGVNPGTDVITATVTSSALLEPCGVDLLESDTVSFHWSPTAASIDANGSVVSFTKSSGNPQGGVAVFECDVAAPGATRVSITSCTAEVNSAPVVTVDGPAAATSGAFTTSRPDGYDVCWSVMAVFPTGSATTSGCELTG